MVLFPPAIDRFGRMRLQALNDTTCSSCRKMQSDGSISFDNENGADTAQIF
jgi:hypothetical protein